LNIVDKFKIFLDLAINNYKEIYILSPKSFYFYLPLVFRKTKFYAIVYDGNKRVRPSYFLRKFLYKYETVYKNKMNKFSYRELQNNLIDNKYINNVNILNVEENDKILNLKKHLPEEYIFFQFRYKFFDDLEWKINDVNKLIKLLSKKYKNVLFSSDIEVNDRSKYFNNYFELNYSIIDIDKNLVKKNNDKNIFYLKNLNAFNLFYVIKFSVISLAKEGIVSHISFFHNKKCHNLFNFKINTIEDFYHEKISYSEWCKGMNFSFSFLNNDSDKAIRKIKKFI